MTVEESFPIAGRGTVVVGRFEGTAQRGDCAVIAVGDARVVVEHVGFEFLDRVGPMGKREGCLALLLHGVSIDAVPVGAVVESEH